MGQQIDVYKSAPSTLRCRRYFTALGWLRERLAPGPDRAASVIRDAGAEGISVRTLRRAKAKLRVESRLVHEDDSGGLNTGTRHFVWRLPKHKPRLV